MAAAHLLLMIGIYCRYEVAALTYQSEVAGRQPIGERHVASVTQSVRGGRLTCQYEVSVLTCQYEVADVAERGPIRR